ncbi:MAG: EFR1 family ferrodoxin [Tannerellaceae bacterium]|nr:EFR1 family ferrodoxin [Tannerellaceae bacterium]
MIFYFTGTGNSAWVATRLAESLPDERFSISELLHEKREQYAFPLKEEEKVIVVFPVHSWGPPSFVLSFIKQLSFTNYTSQPVYAVCTCGDDCGYTKQLFAAAVAKQGWYFRDCYSVTMPNNYILFPGFDVDTKEAEKEKLQNALPTVQLITGAIRTGTSADMYHQGTVPFLKSRVIHPLFNKYVVGKNSFYATGKCISCGLCKNVCPTGTISMQEGLPQWNDTCIQCLACIHRCPQRAIEYGKRTLRKGRYQHPDNKRILNITTKEYNS